MSCSTMPERSIPVNGFHCEVSPSSGEAASSAFRVACDFGTADSYTRYSISVVETGETSSAGSDG